MMANRTPFESAQRLIISEARVRQESIVEFTDLVDARPHLFPRSVVEAVDYFDDVVRCGINDLSREREAFHEAAARANAWLKPICKGRVHVVSPEQGSVVDV